MKKKASLNSFLSFSALMGVLALSIVLYLPFFGSPAVFDDHNFITNGGALNYAEALPFKHPRSLAFTSLGVIQVVSGGDLAWNRYVNLGLHSFVIVALYFFLLRATSRIRAENNNLKRCGILAVCFWISINPLSVYAVAYLVQRNILLATLFSIISTTLYLRAQQEDRRADIFSAALFAGLAVMSKEHAILAPVAAVVLTPLVCGWTRPVLWRVLAFLAASTPCAIWAVLHSGIVLAGSGLEPYVGEVLSQVGDLGLFDFPGGHRVMSFLTQMLLFWAYVLLWLFPNTQWMSADLRIDFVWLWSCWWVFPLLAATVCVLVVSCLCYLRVKCTKQSSVLAVLLLFAFIPFSLELAVMRVQEPFVLYRSYLWMPAFALFLAVCLFWIIGFISSRGLAIRSVFLAVLIMLPMVLFPLAQDRLRSFSSEEALWADALKKLPSSDVAGADRIYYNLAGEAFRRGNYAEALTYSNMVVVQNPKAFQGYLARGTSLLALGELDRASSDFDEADAHNPPPEFSGYIEFKRCVVFSRRKDRAAEQECLERSAMMGYGPARLRLQIMGVESKKFMETVR